MAMSRQRDCFPRRRKNLQRKRFQFGESIPTLCESLPPPARYPTRSALPFPYFQSRVSILSLSKSRDARELIESRQVGSLLLACAPIATGGVCRPLVRSLSGVGGALCTECLLLLLAAPANADDRCCEPTRSLTNYSNHDLDQGRRRPLFWYAISTSQFTVAYQNRSIIF